MRRPYGKITCLAANWYKLTFEAPDQGRLPTLAATSTSISTIR